MGIPERKERQKQKLRQRVLDAAEELFVEEGYQNVSMRKIAVKIEYSTTTINRTLGRPARATPRGARSVRGPRPVGM